MIHFIFSSNLSHVILGHKFISYYYKNGGVSFYQFYDVDIGRMNMKSRFYLNLWFLVVSPSYK